MKTLNFDLDGNLGGLCGIYAIPASSFKRIWQDHANSLNYVRVMNRDDIITIYTSDNSVFTEEYDKGIYQPIVSGFVPATNPLTDSQIKMLCKPANWLVLFQDNNGFWRLAGNAENKLSFKYTDTTGTLSGANQLSFTFSGKSKRKSMFIELAEIYEL